MYIRCQIDIFQIRYEYSPHVGANVAALKGFALPPLPRKNIFRFGGSFINALAAPLAHYQLFAGTARRLRLFVF